jgi:hypothetical protein
MACGTLWGRGKAKIVEKTYLGTYANMDFSYVDARPPSGTTKLPTGNYTLPAYYKAISDATNTTKKPVFVTVDGETHKILPNIAVGDIQDLWHARNVYRKPATALVESKHPNVRTWTDYYYIEVSPAKDRA